MQLDINERIRRIVGLSGLTINGFAKNIGCKSGKSIYNLLNPDVKKISTGIAIKIATTYPNINLDWILTGEGSMLKDKPDDVVVNERLETYEPKNENDMVPRSEYEFIKKQLEEKDKQISKLLNLLSLTTSENEEDKKEEVA